MHPDDEDPEDLIDVTEADEHVTAEFGTIMDMNSGMMARARESALSLLEQAAAYETLAERCRDLATVQVTIATALSNQAAELLGTEFGIEIVGPDDDDDDDS